MSLFDPSAWIPLPGGSAVHRGDLRPCVCGNRRLAVTRREVAGGPAVVRVACLACVQDRAVGAAVGTLDADAGRFEPGRSGR